MIDILVLDYNRPQETFDCLKSVERHAKFEHQVTLLSNGGRQDYCVDFFGKKLVNRLILNGKNEGLGFGTTDLFKIARQTFALYLQNDQFFFKDITEADISAITDCIKNNQKIGSVGIAGDPCHGVYSERAHIISVDFYNSIPAKPNGGAGPFHATPWNEGHIQDFYAKNGFTHYIWPTVLVGDNGKWAVRENPDGSIWRHRTDTKQLELLVGPVKERHVYPNLTDEEWSGVLSSNSWKAGTIPSMDEKHSFVAYF